MPRLFIIAVAVFLGGLLLLLLTRKTKTNSIEKALEIIRLAHGRSVTLVDRATGQSLGVVEPGVFQEMVMLYARETGDISSFYILRELLEMLRPNEQLSSKTIDFMAQLVGDKDDIDVVWKIDAHAD